MSREYDLLGSLFNSKPATKMVEESKVQATTKRTFKISDEVWEDFLSLAKLQGKTQAELLNYLIKEAVMQNKEKINKYNEFKNGK